MLDIVYEETNADVMTNGSMVSSSTQATRSSARLAEKLKKLMQAPAMTEAMDLEEEERQKCAHTPQIGANRVLTPRGATRRALHWNSKIEKRQNTSSSCQSKSSVFNTTCSEEEG